MVQWICGVKLDDEVPMDALYVKLGIQEVMASLRKRLFEMVWKCSDATLCIKFVMSMDVPSSREQGRPKKNVLTCSRLGSIDLQNIEAWRFGVENSSHLLPAPMSGTPTAVQ